MGHFRLKAAAKPDLKNIAKFTEKNSGKEQRNKYLAEFDLAFHKLVEKKPPRDPASKTIAFRRLPVPSEQ
jgi:plasmid stabilization system protein ParE